LSYKNHSSKSITGKWTGNYSWKCDWKGKKVISFNLVDNNGAISGTATISNYTYKIIGYRLVGATLGEWKYINGKKSKKGNNIVLEFINPNNKRFSSNTFSGELKNNTITGITMNGEGCSTYKGPSGNFSISLSK
jgi:hypothetical protein